MLIHDMDIGLAKIYSESTLFIETAESDAILKSVYGTAVDDRHSAGYYLKITIQKITRFIKDAITEMEKFIKEKVQDAAIRMKMKTTLKELKNLPEGQKTVEYYDVWNWDKLNKDLRSSVDKFMKDWSEVVRRNPHTYFMKTSAFVSKYRKKTETIMAMIDKIKETPVKVNAAKLATWLEGCISGKNCAIATMRDTERVLENGNKIIEQIQVKLDEYCAKTGYRANMSEVSDYLFNVANYTKKNADWMIMISMAKLMSYAPLAMQVTGRGLMIADADDSDFELTDDMKEKLDSMYTKSVSPTARIATRGLGTIGTHIRANKDIDNRI